MPLSPALQKLVEAGASKYSNREEDYDCFDDSDLPRKVKIRLEVELYPGERRRITIKAE